MSTIPVPTRNNFGYANKTPVTVSPDWYRFLTKDALTSARPNSAFTPALQSLGTPSYLLQRGYWQKTGNMVYVTISLSWTGGLAASLVITGLPFEPVAAAQPMTVILNTSTSALTWTGTPVALIDVGPYVSIYEMKSATGLTPISNINAGTKTMLVTGTYRV